ncbi:MAG TPA: hypothetical protein PLP79_01020 [Prolixibacteraceae bacterium]|jgi:hypothetical protein|nr:hypothetical protein [Prolixibacteraceae bacterium]HOG95038.1 hypothetical protein [Prolixibacteraceae bacterium]HOS90594.1 hypothetical protein [Prolixibacteraceae bacterium]HPN75702.1 hypothetical protein [Prolixibacteraceae bacterium]HQB67008.1 hypothetical protein [Prolixibacteraceae bacterium]
MKTRKMPTLILLTLLFLSGCGVHTSLVGNLNGNMTNVELTRKNFTVLERISGTSTATYIMGIGGLSNKALIEKAKADMLSRHDLTGGSMAIINLTVEDHVSSFLIFYVKRTVTVSAHLIEFTD